MISAEQLEAGTETISRPGFVACLLPHHAVMVIMLCGSIIHVLPTKVG